MVELVQLTHSATNRYILARVRWLVTRAFSGDEELLSEYHISPGDLAHCVDHTVKLIEESYLNFQYNMKFYVVVLNGQEIGYSIVINHDQQPPELYSFGIDINFRTKEILQS